MTTAFAEDGELLAGLAYREYLARGKGVIFIDMDRSDIMPSIGLEMDCIIHDAPICYIPQDEIITIVLSPEINVMLSEYDPETEMITALRSGDSVSFRFIPNMHCKDAYEKRALELGVKSPGRMN
jgi:hypothetical protein